MSDSPVLMFFSACEPVFITLPKKPSRVPFTDSAYVNVLVLEVHLLLLASITLADFIHKETEYV